MLIQFIVAAVFICAGIFVFAAAKCDTMGALLCIIGVMILSGFTFTTLKFILVIAFLWAASPLASHLIAKAEYVSQDAEDEDTFEEEVIDK